MPTAGLPEKVPAVRLSALSRIYNQSNIKSNIT
jgi:hypothetical protein